MPNNFKKGIALAVLSCIAAPSTSFAQEGSSVVEEIVVTATKRAQTLQETPVAVSVTSAETIEQAQILDVNDLQSVVPSLRITQLQNSTNTNFVIRGFGNGANNPGIEPSVGVFVDGVYRSRSAGAIGDLPTLERVEVLHGPQSTLFGKNASAGVISVVTAKPTGEYGGKVSATFGNRDAFVLKGEVEGSISDTIAYKLSGGVNKKDGYVTNLVTGNDINNRDRYNIRGDLLFNPNDNLEVRVIADFDNLNEECCATVNLVAGPSLGAIQAAGGDILVNDSSSRQILNNLDPTNEQDNYGLSIQADYDFGNVSLTSITSYREIDTFANIDPDFTSADLIRNDIQTDIETFTQEFRLTSTGDGPIDWQIGAFYFKEDIKTVNNLPFGAGFRPFVDGLVFGGTFEAALELGAPLAVAQAAAQAAVDNFETLDQTLQSGVLAGFGVPTTSAGFFDAGDGVGEVATLDNESLTLFGQLDVHFNDRFTGTIGLNYTVDEKEASVTQVRSDVFSAVDLDQLVLLGVLPDQATADGLSALQFLPTVVDFPNAVENGETDDDELTYTLRLAYDLTDSLNVYASYATGFKASSFNLSRDTRPLAGTIPALEAAGLGVANLSSGTRFADPEEASVFEIGIKGSFSRGSYNIALFDQKLENFQSNTFLGAAFSLINAEEQSVYGAEFDITYYPIDALKLTFAATLLEPTYDRFTQGNGVNGTEDLSGEQPAGIHEASFSTSATYRFNLGNNDAFIRGDFYFEDEIQITDNVPASVGGVRETKNLNLSAGLTTPTGYSFSLWARNVTDHETLISSFPSVAQTGTFGGYRNEPRTYGISVSKEF